METKIVNFPSDVIFEDEKSLLYTTLTYDSSFRRSINKGRSLVKIRYKHLNKAWFVNDGSIINIKYYFSNTFDYALRSQTKFMYKEYIKHAFAPTRREKYKKVSGVSILTANN